MDSYIIDYIKSLPTDTLNELYNSAPACSAIYHQLNSTSRTCIMQMLFTNQPVLESTMSYWFSDKTNLCTAIDSLTPLRIIESLGGQSVARWRLNESFQRTMLDCVLGGGVAWNVPCQQADRKSAKDLDSLLQYADKRWESLLRFVVDRGAGLGEQVSRDTANVLASGKLITNTDGRWSITPQGFQFLLADIGSQIWQVLVLYMASLQSIATFRLADALSLVFQLTFSEVGRDYGVDGLGESQLIMLQILRELGVVYMRKRTADRFYPTNLALEVAGNSARAAAAAGYLIVETNYRVYAHTSSELRVGLMGLFCDMLYRFPNLAVGILSRDSVGSALAKGITAENIISFLRANVHPKMLAKRPVIPPTISDQIRLWELERDRLKYCDGVLYNQFLSLQEFELLRDYAKSINVLLWQDANRRMIVVSKAGHDNVKQFWKRHKKS